MEKTRKNNFMRHRILTILLACLLVLSGVGISGFHTEGAYAETGQDIGMTTKSGTPITLFVYESNDLDQMTKEIIAPELTYSYDPENGYTIIFPDSKRNPAMRVETIDSDADNVSVSISYPNALLTSRTITAELGMNKPKPDKFPLLQNLINLAKNPTKAQATLTVKQGEHTKDYPVTFIAKGTLNGNGLSVSSGTELLRLAPEFEGKYTYKYDVYDASPETDIVINATATIAKAEKTSYAYDGQEKKEFVKSFTIDKSVWNNRNKVDVQIIVEGGVRNPEVVPTTYTLTVWKKADKLEIENAPNKTQYVWGELFDKTGMKLKLEYSDGTKEYVDAFHITPEFGLTPDNNQVEISYGGKTVIQPIEVRNPFEGTGTKTDPYQVKKPEDLNIISQATQNGITFGNILDKNFEETRKYFILMDDMELPANWIPIGAKETEDSEHKRVDRVFSGVFYGNNKTITVPNGKKPLFGYVRADIKDLKVYGEQIEGYGLVNNYVIGTYANIDNVTLLSGSKTLKSGFIGGFASGSNTVRITNSKIDENVIIGYDGNESSIGSFAGEFNGVISNCVSYATVKGKNVVGGLVGNKGQAMGLCEIDNSEFYGNVIAAGECAGGIIGAGYVGTGWGLDTAPNTPCVSVKNCLSAGTVQGTDYVGGIMGAEPGVIQCWDNGIGYIQNNLFVGEIKADVAKYIGGIAGYMHSLNMYNVIENNYFAENCKAEKGIGGAYLIDTSCKTPSESSNVVYVNTADRSSSDKPIEGLGRVNHNREDDPLGADSEKLCKRVTDAEMRSGRVTGLLNEGNGSFKNWTQGKEYPIHSSKPVVYEISLSGDYKTKYETGDELITEGVIITAKSSDGTTAKIDKDDKRFLDAKFTGFNSKKRGVQTITVTYGAATATYEVTVLYKPSEVKKSSVFFRLLGDTKHGEPTEATGTHTLKDKNLPETWVERTSVDIDNNTTVYGVMKKVFDANGITWEESNKRGTVYIESLTRNDVTLGEFDNGQLSGWMYTLNGHHSNLGVAQQFLNGGEEIIFHYTDDYTVEEGSDHWNTPGGGVVEEVKNVTTDTKTGTTTAPTEVKVSEKTNADGTKTKVAEVKVSTDNQKEILKQAKASKSKEIILNVSSKSVGDAAKADVTLDKSFIDSIVKDTDAKLTIKTPFGDKTYTQEELKAMSEAATGSTVTVAIEKAAEPPVDDTANAEKIAKAKSIVKDLKLVARSSKTAKKNIKAVLKSDAKVTASIKELKDLGFTVKYRFYRSTKKAASYKSTVTKKTASYTNTSGKKGTKYFYKVQVRVYDENGKLVAKTALKQCKYASRVWTK